MEAGYGRVIDFSMGVPMEAKALLPKNISKTMAIGQLNTFVRMVDGVHVSRHGGGTDKLL